MFIKTLLIKESSQEAFPDFNEYVYIILSNKMMLLIHIKHKYKIYENAWFIAQKDCQDMIEI